MGCGYQNIDGERVWIPGCMSGAMSGGDYCTCYKPIFKNKIKDKISVLEDECSKLRTINNNLNRKNKQLWERINEIQRQGLPLKLRRELEKENSQAEQIFRFKNKNR